ncbi:uncharacterized protein LOC120636739 [Pararge aegeria]|uniref:uncharacterized protein LOC120636739 n=1 Tax=Pararge aegeria TaxID=116150 RepID=UPI0019D216EB|nr:uncharacterized protein LOC120636739 [Pararge aegeria]
MPYGKLHEFDIHAGAKWDCYVRLVEQFILLNAIGRELRVATLVTHVGPATYELMCDLCSPDNPEDKEFEQLVMLVREHLEPKRSEIAERHVFRQRRQAETENVGAFLQNLEHLATHCNFGALLEENIRDQFVSGLRSEEMRSRLFAEPTIDYKKAVELALALEAAERHTAVAASSSAAVVGAPGLGSSGLGQGGDGVHRVAAAAATASGSRTLRSACWRCGRRNHPPNKCKFKFYTCNTCNQSGHLAVRCGKGAKNGKSDQYKSQNYIVQSDMESDASDGLYHFSAGTNYTEPIFCKARPIPLALRIPVERELRRLEDESIIVKVERSDYGTPIVPIIKRDGSIRICGDYNITVNKQLKDFHFPLPRIEQLFAALSGGEHFTK